MDPYHENRRQPVLFIGHGSPENAILDNDFTRTLHELGQKIGRPASILVVSAHWLTRGTYVSTNLSPKTIYDFSGFEEALYHIQYEPQGNPDLARHIIEQVHTVPVLEDPSMGLDHGAWSILRHLFPEANIPCLQLSVDYYAPPEYHYTLGKQLRFLRNEDVLVIGSGNIVHNLRKINWESMDAAPYPWALAFDQFVYQQISQKNFSALFHYHKQGETARLAVPTPDHYFPMLTLTGLLEDAEPVTSFYEGFQYGSIGMRCFRSG